jgi:hypothetical protein
MRLTISSRVLPAFDETATVYESLQNRALSHVGGALGVPRRYKRVRLVGQFSCIPIGTQGGQLCQRSQQDPTASPVPCLLYFARTSSKVFKGVRVRNPSTL